MKSFGENNDFSLYLKAALKDRCHKNPNYSLRSFAKHLSMDASLLSKFLNGKRKITAKQIDILGAKLNLNLQQLNDFKDGLNSERLKKKTYEEKEYQKITQDYFEIISSWQHYAILELMQLSFFKEDPKWIASTLGIKPELVIESIERLQKIELIRIDSKGKWHDLSHLDSTHILDKNITSYAHKIAQKEILQKAIDAMDSTDICNRDQSSMLLASHPSKIAEAKDRITKFRRELTAFLEDTEEKTELYQMSISLYPLINKDLRR